MSRNQSSTTSKYKISNPQPYISAESSRSFPSPLPTNSSPYPSFPPQQAPPSTSSSYRPAPSRVANDASPSGTPDGSPMRPARSRMRDAPPTPSAAPAPTTRRELRPVQTQNLRRPSAGSSTGEGASNGWTTSRYEMPLSPISPISPVPPPQLNGLFTDPFAADKADRTQVFAQANAAARQAMNPLPGIGMTGAGGDKLRNAVGAFMSASKSRDTEEIPARRPAKNRARHTPKDDEVWDVSEEGGKFAEVDGVLRKIRKDWPFVLESDFSPSTLALSLLSSMPSSSLPAHPGLSSFMKLHEALSSALQAAVQAHFQGFAASLPAHATFLSTLGRAQQQVRASKAALREARDGFSGKGKSELAGVKARERMVRDMLKILDVM
jgi:exocyst complex component 4